MKKLTPAFVVTTLFALGSTGAVAMGDRSKDKERKAADRPAVTAPATPAAAGTNAAPPAPESSTPSGNAAVNGTSTASVSKPGEKNVVEEHQKKREMKSRQIAENAATPATPAGGMNSASGPGSSPGTNAGSSGSSGK